MTGHPEDPDRTARGSDGRLAAAVRSGYRTASHPPWLARAAAVSLCLVSLAFVGLVAAGFAVDGQLAVVTEPAPLRVALVLPPLVAAFAAATVVSAAVAWREGYWSRAARVHQTLLAVLGTLFVWQLAVLGFIP